MSRKKKATPSAPKDIVKGEAAEFPVVGIGASAGGLAAFESFFSGMPDGANPGMAFVLVQHLDPTHKSLLTALIQRYTRMHVFEVEDGMEVQINCVYIIPPNRDMAFLHGALHLLEPVTPRGHRLPIDFFFRSMAQDQHSRAIGIVLSGTGSDGTLGLRAIKGEGGLVIAQNADSAEFDGMPSSAIATGLMDYILPPDQMVEKIHAYMSSSVGLPSWKAKSRAPGSEDALKKIFILLRAQTGHDFSQYKPSTMHRRIERRMAVQQVASMEDYARFLQQTKVEVGALFRDLLIGVTNFFRDAEAFAALEEQVIPLLFADKAPGGIVRCWSAGCSTGEEAYSLAILLVEHAESLRQDHRVQVFATDIDPQAIATARTGVYPSSIAADISPKRLARFFTQGPDGSTYQIQRNVRDAVIFSEQDLIRDPPFSKLDLISCRNLMIYLGGDLQKKLILFFHFALNPGGCVFLGTSETMGETADIFTPIDRANKLYRRVENIPSNHRGILGRYLPPMAPPAGVSPAGDLPPQNTIISQPRNKQSVREMTEQALLRHIAPAAVLVTAQGDILYLHGRTGMFFEPTPGEAKVNNAIKMAREGLRRELTTALHRATAGREIIRVSNLRVKTNGDFTLMNLTIHPLSTGAGATADAPLFLIVLEKALPVDESQAPKAKSKGTPSADSEADDQIVALQQALRAKEDYLQASNEELESSNEELKSANEELQSINEELQSANEELETSKEEMHSLNEELATVNTELHSKVDDLTRVNDDMNNLLSGTGIATVFVDHSLQILRFTPAVTGIINLIPGDIGRPVGHIVSNLVGYDSLSDDVKKVLDTLIPIETEVQSKAGLWYTLRILPYRTQSNSIEGAVVTFVDTTHLKQLQEALRLNEERMRVALHAAPILLFNQDSDLRYTWVSDPSSHFAVGSFLGKTDAELLSETEANDLTTIKKLVMESGKGSRQIVKITVDDKSHSYDLTVEPLRGVDGKVIGITCAMTGATEQELKS